MNEKEKQQWLNDYENSREQKRKENDLRLKVAVEGLKLMLQPLISYNLEYLRYMQLKGHIKTTSDAAQQTAELTALTTVIGFIIDHGIEDARKLCFEILQDVNDHENAAKVRTLLNPQLAPHEIE